MNKFSFLIIGVFFLTSACQEYTVNPATPEPEAILVGVTPGLRPINTAIDRCSVGLMNTIVIINEMPASLQSFDEFDILIHLNSQLSIPRENIFLLGKEEIVLITNTISINQPESIDDIVNIFSDPTSAWQVHVYDASNEIRSIFDNALLPNLPLTSEAIIIPHPEGMLEITSDTTNSIGYLPRAWLQIEPSEKLKSLVVGGNLASASIIATTSRNPQGSIKSLLACMQNGVGQKEILKYYKN